MGRPGLEVHEAGAPKRWLWPAFWPCLYAKARLSRREAAGRSGHVPSGFCPGVLCVATQEQWEERAGEGLHLHPLLS